jgi:hypothetical protein
MAKAHITTPDGVKVELEGTPSEIAAVLKEAGVKGKANGTPVKKSKPAKATKVTIPSLVVELKDEGFFRKPKSLEEIRKRLADLGHNYPVTTLSGTMQSQARKRSVRRFKEKGKYVYAQ